MNRCRSTQIDKVDQIIAHIGIQVHAIAITDGIGAEEAALRRAVITRPVVIEAGF